jgi:hypothetical protein
MVVKTAGRVVVLMGQRFLDGEALDSEGQVQVQVRVSEHHSKSRQVTSKQTEKSELCLSGW